MGKLLAEMTLEELKGKKQTLIQQNAMVGLIGSTAGLIYANKTGGGFWRYVGYFVLGGFVVGAIPRLVYFIPKENEIDALILEKSNSITKPTSTTSSKGEIVKFDPTAPANSQFDGYDDL